MPTAEQITATALDWRGKIWRDATGYVNIQNQAPWVGKWDRWGQAWVEHCGIAVCRIWHECGLVIGRDYPDLSYTPSGTLAGLAGNGRYTASLVPRVGSAMMIDWQDRDGLGGYARDVDHTEVVIDTAEASRGYITTVGWNTTRDGRGYVFRRPMSLAVAFVHPYLAPLPPTPPAAPNLAHLAVPAYT